MDAKEPESALVNLLSPETRAKLASKAFSEPSARRNASVIRQALPLAMTARKVLVAAFAKPVTSERNARSCVREDPIL